MKTVSEAYDKGYCLRFYDIKQDVELFKFKDETFRLPVRCVEYVEVLDIFPDCPPPISGLTMSRIEDVRRAHEKFSRGD